MRFCADTWFLISLTKKEEKAIKIMRNVIQGKDRLIIPSIVICEFFKKMFQKGKEGSKVDEIIREARASRNVEIVLLDENIAKEGAKVSFSHGIPTIDSIIAATCKILDCHFLLSDDPHFQKLVKKEYLKMKSW